MTELEERLRARGTDSKEVIADRMQRASDEISHWAEYEYVLVNDEMDECLLRVRAIIAAERSKRVRQTSLNDFVRGLIGPEH
jgi:guanylate kinase